MKKIYGVALAVAIVCLSEAMAQDIKVKNAGTACTYKTTLLDSLLAQVQENGGSLLVNEQIQNSDITAGERIAFLNKDFKTKAFGKACEVRAVDFIANNYLHLGIIDMGISNADKKTCLEIIKQSNRSNFILKVYTYFKVMEKDNELVIIYSENPFNPYIKKLFSEH